jgi:hypothetical protein
MDVLWDAAPRNGFWRGLTANFLKVRITSACPIGNRITRVRIVSLEGDALVGVY